MSVCLSVCKHISKKQIFMLHQIFGVYCHGHSSVLLWWHCDMLWCATDFVSYIMLPIIAKAKATWKGCVLKVTHWGTAQGHVYTEVYILRWRELSWRRLLPAVSPAAGHLTTPIIIDCQGCVDISAQRPPRLAQFYACWVHIGLLALSGQE